MWRALTFFGWSKRAGFSFQNFSMRGPWPAAKAATSASVGFFTSRRAPASGKRTKVSEARSCSADQAALTSASETFTVSRSPASIRW